MGTQAGEWLGEERCSILQEMREEIQDFESLSDDEIKALETAIDTLLSLYGCTFDEG